MIGDIYLRILQLTILPLIASNILVGKGLFSRVLNHLSLRNFRKINIVFIIS